MLRLNLSFWKLKYWIFGWWDFQIKTKYKKEGVSLLLNRKHKSLLILILAVQITPHISECSHNIYIETIDGGFRQAIPALRITIFWQQDTIYYAAHTIIHTNLSHLTGHRSRPTEKTICTKWIINWTWSFRMFYLGIRVLFGIFFGLTS